MASLSVELAQVALDLINEFGTLATFEVASAYSYAPTTGTGSETLVSPSPQAKVVSDEILQGLAQDDSMPQGSSRYFLAAQGLSFTPYPGMKVTIDGVKWSTVTSNKTALQGIPLLYELTLAK